MVNRPTVARSLGLEGRLWNKRKHGPLHEWYDGDRSCSDTCMMYLLKPEHDWQSSAQERLTTQEELRALKNVTVAEDFVW